MEAFLLEYGRVGAEAFRQSKEDFFGIQNSRKARVGGLEGLRDASSWPESRSGERGPAHDRTEPLRTETTERPGKGSPMLRRWRPDCKPFSFPDAVLVSTRISFESGASCVPCRREAQAQLGTPHRLPRVGLQSLELQLFSDAPIYPEYEEAKLAHLLAYWKTIMPDHPLIERVSWPLARPCRPRTRPQLKLADIAARTSSPTAARPRSRTATIR